MKNQRVYILKINAGLMAHIALIVAATAYQNASVTSQCRIAAKIAVSILAFVLAQP